MEKLLYIGPYIHHPVYVDDLWEFEMNFLSRYGPVAAASLKPIPPAMKDSGYEPGRVCALSASNGHFLTRKQFAG